MRTTAANPTDTSEADPAGLARTKMNALRRVNQCGEGTLWAGHQDCMQYDSKLGAPVVTFIHPGTHRFPAAAPDRIVEFFKQHALP